MMRKIEERKSQASERSERKFYSEVSSPDLRRKLATGSPDIGGLKPKEMLLDSLAKRSKEIIR